MCCKFRCQRYCCVCSLTLCLSLLTYCTFLLKNNLVHSLNKQIFSGSVPGPSNPYAPGGDDQFQLPLFLKGLTPKAFNENEDGIAFDIHGQINVTYLDEVFNYINVGDGSGIDNTESTPTLTDALKEVLIRSYSEGQDIDEKIEFYDECKDDDDDERAEFCSDEKNRLVSEKEKLFDNGLDRTSLDASIALIFGNKTTIGQVCAYAKGLEENLVEDVPGFCCLDAPYESKDWGEKVSIK